MPRIMCIGAKQPDTWKERVGKTPSYRIGKVQSTNKARHKVIVLRTHEGLGEKKKKTPDPEDDEPVTIDVEGVVDLETDVGEHSSTSVGKTIGRKIEARHNNTLLVHGLSGTGKTEAMKRIVTELLVASRRHIDTSARENKAMRDEAALEDELQRRKDHTHMAVQETHAPSPCHAASAAELNAKHGVHEVGRKPSPHTGQKPHHDGAQDEKRRSQVSFTGGELANHPRHGHNMMSHRGHSRHPSIDVGLCELARTVSDHKINPHGGSEVPTKEDLKQLGGGRTGESLSLSFLPDQKSVVRLPQFKGLGDKAQKCMIEMWIKTSETSHKMCVIDVSDTAGNCRAAIHLNADYYDEYTKHAVRCIIRDARHKSCECFCLCEPLFDGKWHLLQFHVVSSKEHLMDIRMDGIPLRASISGQSDEPYLFETWEQTISLGGEVRGGTATEGDPAHRFVGDIAEVRAWDMASAPPRLLGHVPLDEGLHHNSVRETVSGESGTVLNHTKWTTTEFPNTGLKMKGFNIINVGTLGTLGQKLRKFSIELWVRTVERKRVMSLLRVTDSQKKHMGLGITLNGNSKSELHGGYLTLFLRDAAGAELIATWVPSQMDDLTDGRWHNIQWKVEDSGSNSMHLKIDGHVKDLVYHARQSPSAFCPFVDFISLGAHNKRGRLAEFFEGMLRHVVISSGDEIIAVWHLEEGPGAKLAVDSGDPMRHRREEEVDTGLHHGIFKTVYPTSVPKAQQKHPTIWLPCDIPDPESVGGALQRQQDKKELARWASNAVYACCLSVEALPKQNTAVFLESLRDVTHNKVIDLTAPRERHSFTAEPGALPTGETPPMPGSRRPSALSVDGCPEGGAPPPETFVSEMLPDSVWKPFEDTDTLMEFFESTQQALEDEGGPRGHRIWIVAVGDAYNLFIDMAGILQHPAATYDNRTARWFSATTSLGLQHRFHACLNKGSTAVLKLFTEVGTFPMLWFRRAQRDHELSESQDVLGDGITLSHAHEEDSFHNALWNDSYVTRIIKSYGLLEVPRWSNLFYVHTCAPNGKLSKVELAFSKAVLSDVGEAGQSMATEVLRKLAQKICIRNKSVEVRKQLRVAINRRRMSTALLAQFPSAGMKSRRIAIVVSAWRALDLRLPHSSEVQDNGYQICDILRKQHYEVYHLDSGNTHLDNDIIMQEGSPDEPTPEGSITTLDMRPTMANLQDLIKKAVSLDAMVFLYVAALSGGSGYYTPPPMMPARYEAYLLEEDAREVIITEQAGEFAEMLAAGGKSRPTVAQEGDDRGREVQRGPPGKRMSSVSPQPQESPRRMSTSVGRKAAEQSAKRVEPGTGGAGKLKKHRRESTPEVDADQSELLMRNAAERDVLQEEEAGARDSLDAEEMSRWGMLNSMSDELQRKQTLHTAAPHHLLLDDSSYENTARNTLAVSDLIASLLPTTPVVGVHRIAFIDAYSWKGEHGWFTAKASSAEHIAGSYTLRSHGVMTQQLVHGLYGHAQATENPVTTEDEMSVVSFSNMFAFLLKRLRKANGKGQVSLEEEKESGTLVGEAIVCPAILGTREKWRQEKDHAKRAMDRVKAQHSAEGRKASLSASTPEPEPSREMGQVLSPFWIDLSYDGISFDPASEKIEGALHEALQDYGGCLRTEHVFHHHLPVVDITLPQYTMECYTTEAACSKTVHTILEQMLGTKGSGGSAPPDTARIGYLVTSTQTSALLSAINEKDFAAVIEHPEVHEAKQRRKSRTGGSLAMLPAESCIEEREFLCLRLYLKGDEYTPHSYRNMLPPRVSTEVFTTTLDFVSDLRKKAMKYAIGKNPDASIGLTGYMFVRFKAPRVSGWRIVKQMRRGEPLQLYEKSMTIAGAGRFPTEEGVSYERDLAHALEKVRKVNKDARRSEQEKFKRQKAKERTKQMTDEAENRVSAQMARIRESEGNLTSNSLTTLFSLQDPVILSKACECLLSHSDAPLMDPGSAVRHYLATCYTARFSGMKQVAPHSDKRLRGFKFIRQCIEWGLLDILHKILHSGTDRGSGRDCPITSATILRLLAACYAHAPQKYVAHKSVSKDVMTVLRRHHGHAPCARWGTHIMTSIIAETTVTGVKKKSALHDLEVLLRVTCASLFAVANTQHIATVVELLSAMLYAVSRLGSHADEGDLLTASRLAVATLSWAATYRGMPQPEMDRGITEHDLQEEAALLSLCLLNTSLPLSEVATSRLLHQGQIKESPYTRPVEETLLSGPNVFVCSACETRFVKGQEVEGECSAAEKSNKKKRHMGMLKADDDHDHNHANPFDDDVLATPKGGKHPFSAAILTPLLEVLPCLRSSEGALEAAAMFISMTEGEGRYNVRMRSHVLQHPSALVSIVDCCVAAHPASNAESQIALSAAVATLIGNFIVDITDADLVTVGTALKTRSEPIKAVLPEKHATVDPSILERIRGML